MALASFEVVGGFPPTPHDIVHYLKSTPLASLETWKPSEDFVAVLAPLRFVIPLATADQLRALARVHKIVISRGITKREQFLALLVGHLCGPSCSSFVSWFTCKPPPTSGSPGAAPFPPRPTTVAEKIAFVRSWNKELSPHNVFESGCAVCARLTVRSEMSVIAEHELDLSPLVRTDSNVTRMERASFDTPVSEHTGPILWSRGVSAEDGVRKLIVCAPCLRGLTSGKLPRHALANGLWVGETPSALLGLSYVEQLVIAKSRHSFCVAQVARSGQRFLAANVIVFGQPIDRVSTLR